MAEFTRILFRPKIDDKDVIEMVVVSRTGETVTETAYDFLKRVGDFFKIAPQNNEWALLQVNSLTSGDPGPRGRTLPLSNSYTINPDDLAVEWMGGSAGGTSECFLPAVSTYPYRVLFISAKFEDLNVIPDQTTPDTIEGSAYDGTTPFVVKLNSTLILINDGTSEWRIICNSNNSVTAPKDLFWNVTGDSGASGVHDFSAATSVLVPDNAGTASAAYGVGGADVLVADGGTGASTASAGLANLMGVDRDLGITGSGATGTTFTALKNGWYKSVVTHEAFTDADETQTVDLFNLPANVEITEVEFYLDTNFSGGGIVTFTADVWDDDAAASFTGGPINVIAGAPARFAFNAGADTQLIGSAAYTFVHTASHIVQVVGLCDVAHDVADATAGQFTVFIHGYKTTE